MAASHKSLSIPDLMYHSNQVDFDGMRKLCAELMPYEWSHMDEPMVFFEMVRAQPRQGFELHRLDRVPISSLLNANRTSLEQCYPVGTVLNPFRAAEC